MLQHEFDHLDGKLYIDRLTDPRQLMFEEEFLRHHADRRFQPDRHSCRNRVCPLDGLECPTQYDWFPPEAKLQASNLHLLLSQHQPRTDRLILSVIRVA